MRIYSVGDLETTGFADDAEIVEMASCLVTLDAERRTTVGVPVSALYRPTCAIEPGARSAHHITMPMLEGFFPATSEDRDRFVKGTVHGADQPASVFVAHNLEYEMKFLKAEIGDMPVICTLKAALRVFPEAPSHSNGVLYYWLQDQGLIPDLGAAAHPMHRAGPDTLITAHLLAVLLQRATTQDMLEWSALPRLMPKINFGKHKGSQWGEAPFDYLKWVADKSDLDVDTKWNAQREIDRRNSL